MNAMVVSVFTRDQRRILLAMLSAVEFTVADIERATGIKGHSIRTFLRRRTDLVDVVGQQATGRPGGSWLRYRLRSGAAAEIAARLEQAEPPPPADIIAAEELLLDVLRPGL